MRTLTIEHDKTKDRYRYVIIERGVVKSEGQWTTQRRVNAEVAVMRMYISL